jgi:hypothetical protein
MPDFADFMNANCVVVSDSLSSRRDATLLGPDSISNPRFSTHYCLRPSDSDSIHYSEWNQLTEIVTGLAMLGDAL